MNKKNKKISIVVACIVGGIILFAINILSYFINSTDSDQQGSDARVNYNVNLDSIWDIGKLKDIGKEPTEEDLEPYYRDNIEDALRDCRIFKEEDKYMRNIDEMIKRIDGDNGVLLFYGSVKDKQVSSVNACKFNMKEKDGSKQYVAIFSSPEESVKSFGEHSGTHKGIIEDRLIALPYMQDSSPNLNKKIFWGYSRTENIYSLEIEGQKPDEIIPYELLEGTEYLWYYLDLQTNGKQTSEMVVEMDE